MSHTITVAQAHRLSVILALLLALTLTLSITFARRPVDLGTPIPAGGSHT